MSYLKDEEVVMVKLVNLTPHKVVLFTEGGASVEIPPAGIVPRVQMMESYIGSVNGIPVVVTRPTGITDLPDPEPNTYYIVSRAVAEAAKREDLLVPDGLIRDEEGRVVGATKLAKVFP